MIYYLAGLAGAAVIFLCALVVIAMAHVTRHWND
jgi:hypothetical protein